MYRFSVSYHQLIEWIGDGTGLSDIILHIHAGMLLLLMTRVLTRRSLGSLVPISVVVVAEMSNELMDRIYFGSWRWSDTSSDVINTLFWPAVICLAVRYWPLFGIQVPELKTRP